MKKKFLGILTAAVIIPTVSHVAANGKHIWFKN